MYKLIITIAAVVLAFPLHAQQPATGTAPMDSTQQQGAPTEHVELLGVKLNAAPQQLIDQMEEHNIRFNYVDSAKQTVYLDGMLGSLKLSIEIRCNKPMTQINLVKLYTERHRYQHEDYATLLHWLCKEYNSPDWHGTVRGHRFCRWFVDFDHDIVLIATGSGTVEVWFYENHQQRNIDYYSILKHCEKNPAANVPFLTATESITWQNDSTPSVRRHVATRHKKPVASRRHPVAKKRRATTHRRGNNQRSKSKKRRRR